MGFFSGVGKAFAGIGRWAEKSRMAMYYGSDWEERLAKQQAFLDQYMAKKSRQDEEDHFRKTADFEYHQAEQRDRAQERKLKHTSDVMGLLEKVQDSGASLEDLDPAIFEGVQLPPSALWAGAAESRGRKKAEQEEKAKKADLDFQNIQSMIHRRDVENIISQRPPKDPAGEKPMTRGQSMDDARSFLSMTTPADLMTGQKNVTLEQMQALAAQMRGDEGPERFADVESGSSTGQTKSRGPAQVPTVNPAAAGPVNPAGAADRKQKAAKVSEIGTDPIVKYQGQMVPLSTLPSEVQAKVRAAMGL